MPTYPGCSALDLPGDQQAVYWSSLAVFALALSAAAVLWLGDSTRPGGWIPTGASTSAVIFSLQILLYGTLLAGGGRAYSPHLDECVPWLRWPTYAASCTLLSVEVARAARMPPARTFGFAVLVGVTLLFGAAAAALPAASSSARWGLFCAGFAPYLPAVATLVAEGHG